MSNISFNSSEFLNGPFDVFTSWAVTKGKKRSSISEFRNRMNSKLKKIVGRNYLSAKKAFKELRKIYFSLLPEEAEELYPIFEQGRDELANVYSNNAADIYDFYAPVLNVSDYNQIAQAAQALAAQRSDLIGAMMPQIRHNEKVKNQNKRLTDLVKRLNEKAAETSKEQRTLQKKVINYQTSGKKAKEGSGIGGLLIPIALGIGGWMLLKG